MMSPQMLQGIIKSSNQAENDFTKEILIPCLNNFSLRNALKLRGIKFTGGASELGNDVEYYELFGPDFLRYYTGIQVKKGDIGLAEATNLITQGIQAFDKEITDASSGHTYRINRWIVAATGEITVPAKNQVTTQLQRYGKPVHFWDGLTLSHLIIDHYYQEFVEKMGVSASLSSSENYQTAFFDPEKPQILASNFHATNYEAIDASAGAPPTAVGLYITVKPVDKNIPGVTCLIRSGLHEITIDSLQSQLQPYLLRTSGANDIEAMLLDSNRPVSILCRGYLDII